MLTNVDLTRIDTTPQFNLGAKYTNNDKVYRYVRYSSGTHSVIGRVGFVAYLCTSGTTTVPNWTVTCDCSAAGNVYTYVVLGTGFLLTALTEGTYGWIQTGGYNDVPLVTDGGVGAGQTLFAKYGENGVITGEPMGYLNNRQIAVSLKDDSGFSQLVGTALIIIDSPDG